MRLLSALFLLWPGIAAAAPSELYADGRDRYTLLSQQLVNRQLFLQLDAHDQRFRLGRHFERVRLAADVAVGTTQTGGGESSRFHGYYLADTFAGVRILDGLEANLNLLLFNPSASDGYRRSSSFGAGLALHAYGDLFELSGQPVRGDVLATDLDRVTLGLGLLVERWPLEGFRGGLSWQDWWLDALIGGRVMWDDDNLHALTLSGFDRLGELRLVVWDRHRPRQSDPFQDQSATLTSEGPTERAWYLGGSVDVPLFERFRVGAEYDARLRSSVRHGLLGRADYLQPAWHGLRAHAGYQFRYYDDGFGPRDALISPTTAFTTPYEEDVYATNSFEYFGISEFFEQWSHTLMLEARYRAIRHVELFADVELWLRYAASRDEPRFVLYRPDGTRAPGRALTTFYRVGASVYPWSALPHRGSLSLTNKQVESGPATSGFLDRERLGSPRRYDPGTYVLFELEAFL